MSRDERRAQLKDLLKEYDRTGFHPARLATAFGLVRELNDILSDTKNTSRMSDAAAQAMKVYEAAIKKHAQPPEAVCKKGCSYCCAARVTVTIPEAFLLARFVREKWRNPDDPSKKDFQEREVVSRGLPGDARLQRRIACPLLIDNACSVYAARPMTCRAYASKSLPACLELYQNFVNNVPHPMMNQLVRTMLFAALKAALSLTGFSGEAYELGHALVVASEPRAEARWLAGEPIFAEVSLETRIPGREQGNDAFELLVDVLKAGAYGKDVPENQWFKWKV